MFLHLLLVLAQISCATYQKTSSSFKRVGNDCEMEAKDLPEFRGLKLNMPINLAIGDISQTTFWVNNKNKKINNVHELGYNEQLYFPDRGGSKLTPAIDTKQLNEISLVTFDEKLVSFTLRYDNSFQGVSSEDVANKIETALKLPKQSFSISDENNYIFVSCKDFVVHVKRNERSPHRSDKLNSVEFNVNYILKDLPAILLARDDERKVRKENSFVP